MPDSAHTRPPVPLHVPADSVPHSSRRPMPDTDPPKPVDVPTTDSRLVHPRSCACVCMVSIDRSRSRSLLSFCPCLQLRLSPLSILISSWCSSLSSTSAPDVGRDRLPSLLGTCSSALCFRSASPAAHFIHISYLQDLLSHLEAISVSGPFSLDYDLPSFGLCLLC
jgi:hypothetical protein